MTMSDWKTLIDQVFAKDKAWADELREGRRQAFFIGLLLGGGEPNSDEWDNRR